MNTILSIVRQKNTCVSSILIACLFLFSCSATQGTIPPIIEESPVDSTLVWKLFLEQYPSERLPYKMKLSSKLHVHGITRRFTIFTLGNAQGLVKMDILTSGIHVAKIAQNPIDSLFYIPSMRKAYITKTNNAKDVEVLVGFSLPLSLDSLCALLSGNASSVFSSYTTVIPRNGLLEYILPDNSQLFLSYNGSIVKWQNTYGWQLIPIYSVEGKQRGFTAILESKKYTMEYIVDSLEDIGYMEPSDFYLQLPPNTDIYTIKENN